MEVSRAMPRLSFGTGAQGPRTLAEEVAVALTFNGTTQAVMMATPGDLVDFAYGFALTEGIATPAEILSVDIEEAPNGLDVQIWLQPHAEARLVRRRRTMAGPVGCGLCGIDSLEEAMRKLMPVPASSFTMTPAQVMQAIEGLQGGQPLHDATRSVHAAGFWSGALLTTREDVGRRFNTVVFQVLKDSQLDLVPEVAVMLRRKLDNKAVQSRAEMDCPARLVPVAWRDFGRRGWHWVRAFLLASHAGYCGKPRTYVHCIIQLVGNLI